ncbi:MAG TPA: Mur ligase domain-containing protein, partial [Longimicrobiales bacterium]|nr:Mur ligase domain-containing protein [Longimicrobiales bacterium]
MRTKEMARVDLRELAARGPVHFVGIAGAGMSALAELLVGAGATVTGCDTHPGSVGARLQLRGVDVQVGQDPAHIGPALAAVIATSAIPFDHPELMAARAAKIPVLKRAQALGALVNPGKVVAVAGTHGKTTTTAMITSILAEAGLAPTGFVGGRVPGWDSGFYQGNNELFVVEADEYDRSFLTLRPNVAVVTTVEADHLDIYGSLEALE